MILVFIACVLFFISFSQDKKTQWEKNRYGAKNGKIIYSDLHRNEKTLFSIKFQLTGKPDYLIKTKKDLIFPVELKTGWHKKPLKHHVMQLIAYCQLVEETTGNSVPYGMLLYYDTDLQFRIPFDQTYRYELKRTIHKMHESLKTNEITINHEDPYRCQHCSVRTFCDKALI